MSNYSTGNPERDTRLRRAIQECVACNEHPVYGNVIEHLPADFDLDADEELRPMLADLYPASAPQIDVPSESLENIEPPHANGAAPLDDPLADDALEPVISVIEAQRLVAESHLRMARATDAQRTARGKVALALERFQRATMQTQDFSSLVREHIQSENQLRADRAAGKIPARHQRRLGSAIDSFAYHTRASGRGAGGGRSFGRGAYPASMRGRVIPKE